MGSMTPRGGPPERGPAYQLRPTESPSLGGEGVIRHPSQSQQDTDVGKRLSRSVVSDVPPPSHAGISLPPINLPDVEAQVPPYRNDSPSYQVSDNRGKFPPLNPPRRTLSPIDTQTPTDREKPFIESDTAPQDAQSAKPITRSKKDEHVDVGQSPAKSTGEKSHKAVTVVREREPNTSPVATKTPDQIPDLEANSLTRVTRDEIKRRLEALKPGEEIKIALSPQVREFVATLPHNAQLSKSIVTIYSTNGDQIESPWYADLSPKSKLLPPSTQENQENHVPTEVNVVQTHYRVTPELIDEVARQFRLSYGREVSPRQVASMIGDFMHMLAAASGWDRYLGPHSLTEFELPSGARPDTYNPFDRRVGEFGTAPQLMPKIIKVARYASELNEVIREGHNGTIFLYDHNAEAWRKRNGK